MTCLHPNLNARVSYDRGCRCERCTAGKLEVVYRSRAKHNDTYNSRRRQYYAENAAYREGRAAYNKVWRARRKGEDA